MSEAVKGKCFSKVNRGQRNKNDFYQTPYSMTEQLLDEIADYDFRTGVLEPAAGDGAIIRVLHKRHVPVSYTSGDIRNGGPDFMEREAKSAHCIITNPPFSLSLEFIQQCKRVARNAFWLLMPIEYLHGQERYEKVYSVNDNFPLHRVYIFTRRAMLSDTVREDGCYPTGMVTWAWYEWLKRPLWRGKARKPELSWIDNNKYVLRKK